MNLISFYNLFRLFSCRGVFYLGALYKIVVFLIFNSVVPLSCKIGRGSRFMYGGIGCVIHKNAIIGENVAIGQGVTIGRKKIDGAPIIGNDVYIGAGSRILGDITIGDNVIIGANAVVLNSVPNNSIVAGAPAVMVRSTNGSIWDELGNIL